MASPIPQITIFLDSSGTPRCEAPGANGSRQKIDLPMDFAERNPELMAELQIQRDAARERARKELQALQTENIKNVISSHGELVAARIWHNGDLAFNRSLKRALKDTNLGANNSSKPKAPSHPNAVNITLDLSTEL